MPVGECFWSRGVIKSCQRIRFLIIYVWYGALAQLGERYTGSVEVVGSSPIGSISLTSVLIKSRLSMTDYPTFPI